MPTPRTCSYCGKTFMTSTYGIIFHVQKCKDAPSELRETILKPPEKKKFKKKTLTFSKSFS